MTPSSDFFGPLRIILGDTDVAGVFEYQDATLASAIKTVFRLGRNPEGYALSAGGEITPDLPDGNDYAKIAYEAVCMLLGGEDGALSYSTRAISVNRRGDRKRDLLFDLKQKLFEIEAGDGFETYQTFLTWTHSVYGCGDLIEAKSGGPIGIIQVGSSMAPPIG